MLITSSNHQIDLNSKHYLDSIDQRISHRLSLYCCDKHESLNSFRHSYKSAHPFFINPEFFLPYNDYHLTIGELFDPVCIIAQFSLAQF